jgi:4'-phosphopantetheinyl transferase
MIVIREPSFSPLQLRSGPLVAPELWLLNTASLDIAQFPSLIELLSPGEQAQAESLLRNREKFLFSRALLRLSLSIYTNTPAPSLKFDSYPQGKPFLQDCDSTFFNISHSGDWVALAIGPDKHIGVDIEVARARKYLAIAKSYFHADEYAQLLKCQNDNEQKTLFFQLWTLKEAFFKALGSGISTGLHKINIDLKKQPAHAAIATDLPALDWQFFHTQLNQHTFLSVANPQTQALEPRIFDALPLLTASRI